MVEKIKECVKAKKDKNFKIIARSDAKEVEGIDKMIDRCKAYIDAGAEIIFPEALANEKDFELVRKNLDFKYSLIRHLNRQLICLRKRNKIQSD